MGPDAMILVVWMLSFKPTFSLSSFTFIRRLFSSSLSAIRVVSSAYLKLLILLPEILIPACASSSPAFLMMYSACKLNKQGDNIQPWRTSFPIWNQSVVPCPVLTVASWPAYRFLRRHTETFKIRHISILCILCHSLFLKKGTMLGEHFCISEAMLATFVYTAPICLQNNTLGCKLWVRSGERVLYLVKLLEQTTLMIQDT